MTDAPKLHDRLMQTAKELDLPKAFHADLTKHDLDALTAAPDNQMLLWGIGECGTHMVRVSGEAEASYYSKRISGPLHWYLIRNGQLEPYNKA